MLKLSGTQLDHLRDTHTGRFQDAMVGQLGQRFPLRAAALGPPGLARLVQRGLAAAAVHGITAEQDVARLTALLVGLGEEHPWISDVLDQSTPQNISARLVQLGRRAVDTLSAAPDPSADQQEAAKGLAQPEARPGERTPIDPPIAPCPDPPDGRRLCPFSS
jgi:hypothetical protein